MTQLHAKPPADLLPAARRVESLWQDRWTHFLPVVLRRENHDGDQRHKRDPDIASYCDPVVSLPGHAIEPSICPRVSGLTYINLRRVSGRPKEQTFQSESAIVMAFEHEQISEWSVIAKPWTREDEQRLLELAREPALTQREIGQKLGRSEAAVNFRLSRLRKLGVRQPDCVAPME